ncbi:MAG: PEGA domain-containing protein [Thermodesulfobacteria bacterium]|nr:PEGA domain-containing protein [Thermodesulfobacteriota bacterium]
MKKVKNTLFLIFVVFLFLSTGCAQNIQTYEQKANKAFQELEEEFQRPGVQERESSKVVLKACGYGKSLKEAKNSALKGLSQQIISQVQAQEKLYKKSEQGKVYRKYVSSSEIITKSLLKGVNFKNFGKTDLGYKVCAYFTENSLKETIDYLKSALSVDFSKMNRAQLKNALTKAGFLLNLAFLSSNKKKIETFAKEKINEISKYLNYGCLVVNVIPSNAKVIINGKTYASGQPIYLPPETSYIVKIEAPGYESVIKNVYLGRGERKSLSIELIKKLKTSLEVYVFSNVKFLIDEASDILSHAGFKITSLPIAPNAIYIKLKDTTIKVDEYTKHTLYMYVTAYKGEEKFLELRGITKGFFTTPSTEVTIVKKEADKLLKAVLIRLINVLNVDKFKGKEDFDYSKLFGVNNVSLETNSNNNFTKRKKTQIANVAFSSLKNFAKWLVKKYQIKDFTYDIFKPDPSGEFYTSIITHKRYEQEVKEGTKGKYLLLIKFKVGYPKNVLNVIKNYLINFSKRTFENISSSEVFNYKYTVFLGLYSTIKTSALWNFGLRMIKSKFDDFKKYLENLKKNKTLEISFKDNSGITIFGLKYKFSYCHYWKRGLRSCIFSLENNPREWMANSFEAPWTWESRENIFVVINGWQEVTLKGFVPQNIANQIKSVDYKF